jgi:hypothetical protein
MGKVSYVIIDNIILIYCYYSWKYIGNNFEKDILERFLVKKS